MVQSIRRIKLRLFFLVAVVGLFSMACHDNGGDDADSWSVRSLWPTGSLPIPSPNGDAVLFVQEEAPAGLYLLKNSAATRINPSGPEVRSDYAWSSDGQSFSFSSPGQPGEGSAGIYVAEVAAPTVVRKVWDRGSHPRFLRDEHALVCAGPEDGSDQQGIWQINLDYLQRHPLAPVGTSPEVSQDGMKISYLIPGDVFGRVLVVLNRETGHRDTLTNRVLNYAWLGDSDHLAFELGGDGPREVFSVGLTADTAVSLALGSFPAGFPQGQDVVFTGISGDRIDGLFICSPGHAPTRISYTGTRAAPAGMDRILAQDSTGLIEIVR